MFGVTRRGWNEDRIGFQGTRVHLAVNRQAADELASMFGMAAADASLSPRRRSTDLVLPDGRTLTVTVDLVDVGAIVDKHGEWIDDDRESHADVGGDFADHAAALEVIAAATAPIRSVTEPAAADADTQRIRRAADLRLGVVDAATAERVTATALRAANATRATRLAAAQRRHRDSHMASLLE